MFVVGKRAGQPPVVASAAGLNKGLLFLRDKLSRWKFLVDTGAEVSVLPATGLDWTNAQDHSALVL